MNALHGLKVFSKRWTVIAGKLLSEHDRWDFTHSSPTGAFKAIAQIETGIFFASVATAIDTGPPPVTSKSFAEGWIEDEILIYGIELCDFRKDKIAYAKAQKRVVKSIKDQVEDLVFFKLIKVTAQSHLVLTETGMAAFKELRE
ncbi:hypothetical protein [Rhizobium sp. SG_E_25_P2]|uniref:hypothetical protein n=1 Tax=Rhizobium sp. SG_E_25_P2 TaxID=2879942 RepID=UPI00247453D0|nr:hypothetical protein [Rhizobium sp. SG_E_25_P2]